MPSKSRWEWTPPPSWPKPPPDWSPPRGWQPEPSWPPPPQNWCWWRPKSRTRSQRVTSAVLIGSAATIVVLLVAAQLVDDAIGCGSIDPTDPANYSVVSIVNDTSHTVVVDDCDGDYCDVGALPDRLAPGQTYTDNAGCDVFGEITSWRLTGSNGQVLGYITVRSSRSVNGLVYDVSHASPDRSTPTPPGAR